MADTFGGIADGVDAVAVTVTVLDRAGLPLENRPVSLAVRGAGGFVTQPAGRTDVAGQVTAALTATIPGSKTVIATVDPSGTAVEIAQRASSEFIRIEEASRFVRQSGSDTNTGATPREAWRTIAFALTQLAPGDTLYVGAGLYPEVLDVTTSGNSGAPITLRGDSAGLFTGDAGEVVVDAQGASYAFRFDGVSHVVVRGFAVTGSLRAGGAGAGILVENGATDVYVAHNRVFGNECGIWLEDTTRVTVESNLVSNNFGGPGDGIRLERAVDSRLEHNLVYNNAGYGVHVVEGSTGLDFQLNTLYRNANDQIHESIAGSTGTIANCVISEGLANGVFFAPATTLAMASNLVWGHAGDDISGGPGGPPSGSGDPLFVDPAGDDGMLGGLQGVDDIFLFDAASPALDAGNATASATHLFFGGALSGYSSRLDGILDGAVGDGATLNLGLHERVGSLPFEPLDDGDGRAFFVESDGVQVRGRSRSASGWSAEGRGESMNRDAKWLVSQVSPANDGEELAAVLTDDGAGTELYVRRWTGRRWIEDDPFHPLTSAIRSANSGQRGFDLEYEALSGDALLVRSNDDENPVFRTLSNGVWSDDAPVFGAPIGSGTILWVELARRPGTDEIALVCLDDAQNLTAMIWDGDAWETAAPTLLGNQMATVTENKAFDVAYESVSGDLFVAWGHTIVIEETRWAERSAATGTWRFGQHNSTDASGVVVRLAADPISDRILGGFAEGSVGDDTVGMIWDGNMWTHAAEFDLTSHPNQRDLAVGWVGDTGRAVLVYRDDDGGGSLDWASWTTGGWRLGADAALPAFGDFVFAETFSMPGEDRLLVLAADDSGDLFSLAFDGASWVVENGGAAIGSGLDVSGANKSFDLSGRP